MLYTPTERLRELNRRLNNEISRANADSRGSGQSSPGSRDTFETIKESTEIQYALDKEERDSNGWSLAWRRQLPFEGDVQARYVRRTAGGKVQVSYKGRTIIADNRSDKVLRLGDTVRLTSTDSGYIVS